MLILNRTHPNGTYSMTSSSPSDFPCTYKIIAPDGFNIRLTFVSINFSNPHSYGCMNARDYLDIYDGVVEENNLINKICRSESRLLLSTLNEMTIVHDSNTGIRTGSFEFQYNLVDASKCFTQIYFIKNIN